MFKTILITLIFHQTILFSKKIDFNAMAPLHVMHYNDSNLEEEKKSPAKREFKLTVLKLTKAIRFF